MATWAERIGRFERAIDRAVGIVAPGVEAKRLESRINAMVLRQYAAAKDSRMSGDWAPATSDVNTLIRTSSPTVRHRTRQLVRDFAYFSRAVKVLVDHTVGTGVVMQSRVTRGRTRDGKSKLHTSAVREIEDVWKRWMDECDASGRLHYHELERLWKRQDVECGESLLVLSWDNSPGRYLPLTVQMYEPDWLTSDFAKAQGNNLLDQGLEFDPLTGRVVAYHFAVPDGFLQLSGKTRTTRVPAEHVVHGYETLRPGQLRGISPFTPAILLADDLDQYLGAEISRANMAAKWLAFVETADVGRWMRGRATTDAETGHKVSVLENAIIDFMAPGDKININAADVPGQSFTPFTKFVLQMVAVATGVTYELLSGDYQGLNYNTTRTLRNDFAKSCRPMVQRHIRQFSQPLFRAVLDAAHLKGRLSLPGYGSDPGRWAENLWQPPGVEPLDLLRESRGQIDLVDNLLYSPQELITGRGRDPEDVLNEIAEFNAAASQRSLDKAKTSKAVQTNPAAVSAHGKKQTPADGEDQPEEE